MYALLSEQSRDRYSNNVIDQLRNSRRVQVALRINIFTHVAGRCRYVFLVLFGQGRSFPSNHSSNQIKRYMYLYTYVQEKMPRYAYM